MNGIMPDEKCAPAKKFDGDTCFSNKALHEIANAYNNSHNDKVNISLPKEKLVNQLQEYKHKYEQLIKDLEIQKQTFENDLLKKELFYKISRFFACILPYKQK